MARFQKGQSGHSGRKPGLLMSTVSKQLRRAAQKQLAPKADVIVANAVELAAAGDPVCGAACLNLMSAVIEPPKKKQPGDATASATNSQ